MNSDLAIREMRQAVPRPLLSWFEDSLSLLVLSLMAILPIIEIVGRALLGRGIPGSIVLVQHMTLWITLLGAALAARSGRLLALSSLTFLPEKLRPPVRVATSLVATGITGILFVASLDFVRIEHAAGTELAWGIPAWLALTILPVGFGVITLRLIWHASETHRGRLLAASGLAIPVIFGTFPLPQGREVVLPCFLLIVIATMLEMPIFTAIGGIALLGLWSDGTPINSMPGETYRLTVHAMLPAIPLFALGGYILAEGGASRRLMRLSTAWVGWMPGGLAVVTALVLAFFTPLTGGLGYHHCFHGRPLSPGSCKSRLSPANLPGIGDGLRIHWPALFSQPSGIPLCVLRKAALQRAVCGWFLTRPPAGHLRGRLGRRQGMAERSGADAIPTR